MSFKLCSQFKVIELGIFLLVYRSSQTNAQSSCHFVNTTLLQTPWLKGQGLKSPVKVTDFQLKLTLVIEDSCHKTYKLVVKFHKNNFIVLALSTTYYHLVPLVSTFRTKLLQIFHPPSNRLTLYNICVDQNNLLFLIPAQSKWDGSWQFCCFQFFFRLINT